VNYLVEVDRDDFWEKGSAYLQKQIHKSLKKRFPKRIKLTEEIHIQRDCLTYRPIDYPNANILRCPICKRFITDTTKPNPINAIEEARELEGVLMCSSCAWETAVDVKSGRSIESILADFE